MVNTQPIPPFAPPKPPPPPLIVLLNDTNLVVSELPKVLLREDLPLDVPQVRFHPYPRRPASPRPPTSSLSPRVPCLLALSFPFPSPAPHSGPSAPGPKNVQWDTDDDNDDDDSEDEEDELSDDLSELSELSYVDWSPPGTPAPVTVVRKIRIPRPTGAGRQNVVDLVNWDEKLMAAIKADVRLVMMDKLDISKCYNKQDVRKIVEFKEEMVKRFRMLDDYAGVWPLDVMLINLLRYSSRRGKKKQRKKAGKGQEKK